MKLVERTLIRAPADRVWAVLSEWERQATWMPDVAWVRPLGPERELGARVAVRTRVLGIPALTDLLTVTAWEPPHRLAVDHAGLVKGRGEWRLEEAEAGTRFIWTDELRMPPPVMGDLALLVYSPIQRWMLRRSLRNLGRLVEAG
jgi:carbon monoxide dehydrogenase subunit G